MTRASRLLAVLALVAAALVPEAAQAQYYGAGYGRQPPPLYPYEPQPNQPYAIQVAPNTYVIRRPAASVSEPRPLRSARSQRRNDPALIEELRRRHSVKREAVNTVKVVRDPPVVIETKRYVDDPPRVVERHHYVEDAAPAPSRRKKAVAVDEPDASARASRGDGKKRVIAAEAEITIIGPDRMSIRLFRKRSQNSRASSRTE